MACGRNISSYYTRGAFPASELHTREFPLECGVRFNSPSAAVKRGLPLHGTVPSFFPKQIQKRNNTYNIYAHGTRMRKPRHVPEPKEAAHRISARVNLPPACTQRPARRNAAANRTCTNYAAVPVFSRAFQRARPVGRPRGGPCHRHVSPDFGRACCKKDALRQRLRPSAFHDTLYVIF